MTQTLADVDALPPKVREALQAQLEPGEPVFWATRPDARRMAREVLPLVLFGTLPLGFGVLWVVSCLGFGWIGPVPVGLLMGLVGLVPLGLGLLLVTAPAWVALAARRSVYAVTDRRALLVATFPRRLVESTPPEGLRSLEVTRRADGSGDIAFRPRRSGKRLPDGFHALPEVQTPELLLRTLAEEAAPADAAAGDPPSGAPPGAAPLDAFADVPRTHAGNASASFRTCRTRLAGANLLVLEPTLGARVFYGTFLVAGLGALLFALPGVVREEIWLGVLVLGLVGGAFTAVGAAGLLGWLGESPVFFDRSHRRIRARRRALRRFAEVDGVPFDRVRAVQVCSRYVPGDSDSAGYRAWELNLVFREPPDQRVCLTCHGREKALREDARQVADMLGVPLLDHAQD